MLAVATGRVCEVHAIHKSLLRCVPHRSTPGLLLKGALPCVRRAVAAWKIQNPSSSSQPKTFRRSQPQTRPGILYVRARSGRSAYRSAADFAVEGVPVCSHAELSNRTERGRWNASCTRLQTGPTGPDPECVSGCNERLRPSSGAAIHTAAECRWLHDGSWARVRLDKMGALLHCPPLGISGRCCSAYNNSGINGERLDQSR